MPLAEVISIIATSLWFLVLVAQLGTISAAVIDAGRVTPRIPHESASYLTWVLPLAVVGCIPFGLGVAAAWRIATTGSVAVGALLAVVVVSATLGLVGLVARGAVARRRTLSGFLDELRSHRGIRMHPDVVRVLRDRFAALVVAQPVRWHPDTVVSRRRHLVPILAGVVAVVTIGIAHGGGALTAAALALPAINLASALVSIRTARAALDVRRAVDAQSKSDIAQLLDDLTRSSRRGIAGLSERAYRALRILREQDVRGR